MRYDSYRWIKTCCLAVLIAVNLTACDKNIELPMPPPVLSEQAERNTPGSVVSERERLVGLNNKYSVNSAYVHVNRNERPFGDDYYWIDIEHRVASIRDMTGSTAEYILDEAAAEELSRLLSEYALTVYDSQSDSFDYQPTDCTMVELFEYYVSYKHGSYREKSAYNYPEGWDEFVRKMQQLIVARSLDSGVLKPEDCLYKIGLESEDKDQSRYITMRCTPAEAGSGHPLTISVYQDEAETVLIQQIESTTVETYFHEVKVEDVDFDGNLDFYWPTQKLDDANWRYTFWIWDETAQSFISDPYQLNLIITPEFDSEKQILKSEFTADGQAVTTKYLTYGNGSDGKYLSLIRAIYAADHDLETGHRMMVVQEFVDGNIVDVYRQDIDAEGVNVKEAYQNLSRWHDLSYHGEEW